MGVQRNERLNLVCREESENHKAFHGINGIHDEPYRLGGFLKRVEEAAVVGVWG